MVLELKGCIRGVGSDKYGPNGDDAQEENGVVYLRNPSQSGEGIENLFQTATLFELWKHATKDLHR